MNKNGSEAGQKKREKKKNRGGGREKRSIPRRQEMHIACRSAPSPRVFERPARRQLALGGARSAEGRGKKMLKKKRLSSGKEKTKGRGEGLSCATRTGSPASTRDPKRRRKKKQSKKKHLGPLVGLQEKRKGLHDVRPP